MEREAQEEQEKLAEMEASKKQNSTSVADVYDCKPVAPFWWRTESRKEEEIERKSVLVTETQKIQEQSDLRWQEQPEIFRHGNEKACTRRLDMTL